MYYCWDNDPNMRPSFSECVTLLENLIMTETDYIELERFPDHSYYNMMSLSGEKLWSPKQTINEFRGRTRITKANQNNYCVYKSKIVKAK